MGGVEQATETADRAAFARGVGAFEDDHRREPFRGGEAREATEAGLQFYHLLTVAFLIQSRMGRGAFEQTARTATRLLRRDRRAAARDLTQLSGDDQAGTEVAVLRLGPAHDDLPWEILAAALATECTTEREIAVLGEQEVFFRDHPALGVGVLRVAEAFAQRLLRRL